MKIFQIFVVLSILILSGRLSCGQSNSKKNRVEVVEIVETKREGRKWVKRQMKISDERQINELKRILKLVPNQSSIHVTPNPAESRYRISLQNKTGRTTVWNTYGDLLLSRVDGSVVLGIWSVKTLSGKVPREDKKLHLRFLKWLTAITNPSH